MLLVVKLLLGEINMDIEIIRHSLAHVMAKAVCKLYKDVKLTIGPAIKDGFYFLFLSFL